MEIAKQMISGGPAAANAVRAPFRFYTSLILPEATGLRAATLPQLLALLRQVPERCIYQHTHYFLLSHHYLTPGPTNDFAYWVAHALGDELLGERLASLDILAHPTLEGIRQAFIGVIEEHLKNVASAQLRFADDGEEFFFIKSLQVVLPTAYEAGTLEAFAACLSQVSVHSLYYHIFDARLRLKQPTNDFALWLKDQLGRGDLAEAVTELDPYSNTLENLRAQLIAVLRSAAGRAG